MYCWMRHLDQAAFEIDRRLFLVKKTDHWITSPTSSSDILPLCRCLVNFRITLCSWTCSSTVWVGFSIGEGTLTFVSNNSINTKSIHDSLCSWFLKFNPRPLCWLSNKPYINHLQKWRPHSPSLRGCDLYPKRTCATWISGEREIGNKNCRRPRLPLSEFSQWSKCFLSWCQACENHSVKTAQREQLVAKKNDGNSDDFNCPGAGGDSGPMGHNHFLLPLPNLRLREGPTLWF